MKEECFMKKLTILILSLCLIMTMMGCSSKDNSEITGTTTEKVETETTTVDTVQPGGTDVNDVFDVAVSYANWSDSNEFYITCLNSDKLAISSVPHLPVHKFDTLEELEQFKKDYSMIYTMDYGHDEVPSFNEVTVKYDEEFFKDNSVILVYVTSSSGSDRYGVSSIFCNDDNFCVYVKQTNDIDVGTDDMAGWFITVAVPDSMIENCTTIDACYEF